MLAGPLNWEPKQKTCYYYTLYQGHNARLKYLQCISNGAAVVLHYAIDIIFMEARYKTNFHTV